VLALDEGDYDWLTPELEQIPVAERTPASIKARLRELSPDDRVVVHTDQGVTIVWDPDRPDADPVQKPTTKEKPMAAWEDLLDNSPEDLAKGFAASEAELEKAKAEISRLKAAQPPQGQQGQQGQAATLSPAEAWTQIQAVPMHVQDAGGHWVENPDRIKLVDEIVAKAGVTPAQYREAHWR
jgi:hypothetical protein